MTLVMRQMKVLIYFYPSSGYNYPMKTQKQITPSTKPGELAKHYSPAMMAALNRMLAETKQATKK